MMTNLSKTHEASLDAIVLRSFHICHTMGLDLVLHFLRDGFDNLISEKEIEYISNSCFV